MQKSRWKIMTLAMGSLFVFTALTAEMARAAGEQMSAVKIAEEKGVGRYLTDPDGMTLYYFTKDSPTMSACTGACVAKWPIFYSEITMAPEGYDVKDFNKIDRADGKKQSTYKGKPLYYFVKDVKPGDTNGHGVGEVWYVVAP